MSIATFLLLSWHGVFKAISRQIRKSESQAELRWQRGKRILGLAEWNAIQEALEEMPEESLQSRQEKSRTTFLVALLFFLGLRVEELCQHKMKDFKKEFDFRAQKDRWWLVVKGKGDKLRKIPVNQSLLQALIDYRQALGLEALPCDDQQEEPLLGSLRGRRKISPARVNQMIKTLCQKAALKFEPLDEKALKLKKVSAHWFRHLSFSMQDLVNIKKQHIKENAGHESEATTALYVHALDDFRHEEMEKLSWKIEIFKEPNLVGVS